MPRIVVLSSRFLTRCRALGLRSGSALQAEVGRVVGRLAGAEELPLRGDAIALVPPTGRAWVRRVPRRNLWLWYKFTPSRLMVVGLTAVPPVYPDE